MGEILSVPAPNARLIRVSDLTAAAEKVVKIPVAWRFWPKPSGKNQQHLTSQKSDILSFERLGRWEPCLGMIWPQRGTNFFDEPHLVFGASTLEIPREKHENHKAGAFTAESISAPG